MIHAVRRHCLLAVALLATILPAEALTAQQAQQAVDQFVGNKALRHAAAGVAVMRLDSGIVVASNLLDQAIVTASTMKTVTSSVALETLGGDFRFETSVLMRGYVDADTLHGDLVIVGGGDPTLGSHYFAKQPNIVNEIVQALAKSGIKVVEGNVVTEESLYPYPPYSIHWDVGDLAWDYGAAVHAINFADNVAYVSFDVDKWGNFSRFVTRPRLSDVRVINNMVFNKYHSDVDYCLDYGTTALVLSGPVSRGHYDMKFANPHPACLLADSVVRTLQRRGVAVLARPGVLTEGRRNGTTLLTHYSPPLTDIVTSLLDRSDNMFAHALLRAVAVRDARYNNGTNLDRIGVQCVASTLKAHGVDTDALFMRDGSGLARAGKASPHMFVQMLAYMAQQRYGTSKKRLCDMMPQAGSRIGSLLPATKLSRDIVIKSGSMTDVQCFVGYYPANEPQYAFAVLVNNYNCSRKELKNLIDRMLINIFAPKK